MKDTTTSWQPATSRTQWAEPAWRERLYSLSLLPEAESGETLGRIVEDWQTADGQSLSAWPMPYIQLATFTGREAMEETLTRWMQRICRTLPRFNLRLVQPTLLPDGSLRMAVAETAPLQKLIDRLDVLETYIKSCGTGGVEWTRNPCCRIGRTAPPQKRLQTHPAETVKTLETVFPVHCLTLEKRTHAEDGSEKVYLCPLSP